MIKVSVIMPVYNSEKYLVKSIQSVLEQSLKEMELILIDDGSTDKSGEICDEFAKNDARVKVVHQKNKGLSCARNVGLGLAKGEYLAFADNDDECLPGFLEKNYEIAKKYDVDMVKFGRISVIVDENGTVYGKTERNLKETVYEKQEIQENYFELRGNDIFSPVWDGLYRNSMVQSNCISFPEELRYGEEDTIFCLRCVQVMNRLALNEGIYFKHYFRKKHSQSSKFHPLTLDKLIYSALVEREVLDTFDYDVDKYKYVLNNVKYQLIQILLQLYHQDCTYSLKMKKDYLKHLKEYKVFRYGLNKQDYKILFSMDKKKTVFLWLFENNYYTVLLGISAIYKKVINFKLKKIKV